MCEHSTHFRIHALRFTKIVCIRVIEGRKRGKDLKQIYIFPPPDYMCLTSRQSSPPACLLEICEVTGHMVHTGQLFSTEWNDWLHHNCPRQESSLTKDLPGEKETCILHDRLNIENEWILKKKWIKCMDAFPKKKDFLIRAFCASCMLQQSWYPDAQLAVSETLSHLHWPISVTMGATIVQLYTLDFVNVSFNIYFLNITVDSLSLNEVGCGCVEEVWRPLESKQPSFLIQCFEICNLPCLCFPTFPVL